MSLPQRERRRATVFAAALVYALALAYVTLWPRHGVSGAIQANWVPGASIRELFDQETSARLLVRNLLGNLLLLTPLALLLVTGLGRTWRQAVIACAGATVAIEVLQASGLFDGRGLNIDDVLLNVTGAAVVAVVSPQQSSAADR